MPAPGPPIALGPFDLLALAGHGGMGLVWRGVHRVRRVPVAIKCLRPERGIESWRALFLREVQAIARLEHPGIVPLHAFGALPKPIPMPDAAPLPAGTPYLVMDWIGGGVLSIRRPMDWPGVRRVLVALLDALAHAHARGVVHRDVKPANVLLDGDRPILTDFGLAHHDPSGGPAGDGVSGTPGYMAPEQAAGQGWRIGPWTDLYAVGSLGWALMCGRPPYADSDPRDRMRALLAGPPRHFAPRMARPAAFDRWLKRMMARDPARRFPTAAHARSALPSSDEPGVWLDPPPALLDGQPPSPGVDPRVRGAFSGTDATASTVLGIVEPSTVADGPTQSDAPRSRSAVADTAPMPTMMSAQPDEPESAPRLAAPLPADWRGEAATPALYLDLAGETVADLRDPPLHGRAVERDRLWAALRSVAAGEGGRAVVLTGGAGVGKSRLARWLAERAHHDLGARRLRVRHAPTLQPGTGPRAMIARALRIAAPGARAARVQAALPDAPGLAAAVLALFDPEGSATVEGIRVHLRDRGERLGAVARLLEHWARRRLLVVHIEDGQWADEALRLMRWVLDRMNAAPILWLVSTRVDLSPSRAGTGAPPISDGDPRVESLPVAPLTRDALTAALRGWLPLSLSAVDRVVQRAGGSPRYAVEVIRGHLRSGAGLAGSDGLRLDGPALPADLDQVWRIRLDAEFDRAVPDTMRALELAALIGLEIDEDLWRAVCARPDGRGVAITARALELMLAARLAYVDGPGRWRFVHPAVRDGLLARGSPRAAEGHRRCATALADRLVDDASSETLFRLGEHLLAAGEPEPALGYLLDAGRTALRRRDYVWLSRVVLTGVRAMRALGRPMTHPAGIELRLLWSHPHPKAEPGRAGRHARRAARDAAAIGDLRLETRAVAMLSNLWVTPSAAEALPYGERAAALAAATGELELNFDARLRLTYLLRSVGRLGDAAEQIEAAAALPVPDTPAFRVRLAVQRALVAQYGGDVDQATALLQGALSDAIAAGDVQARIQIEVTLGEMDRGRGDLELAERRYREAGRLSRLTGHAGGDFNAINLGLVLVARRRFVEARRHLEATRVHLERTGVPIGVWLVNLALLPCDAVDRNWAHWDDRWPHLGAFLDGRFVDPDIADIALTAAVEAEAAGAHRRADDAWRLAEIQLDALGRHEKLARVRAEWTAARRDRDG